MKICPIMTGRGHYFNSVYCYKEECALYNEDTKSCCFKGSAPAPQVSTRAHYPESISSDTEFMVNNSYSFEVGM